MGAGRIQDYAPTESAFRAENLAANYANKQRARRKDLGHMLHDGHGFARRREKERGDWLPVVNGFQCSTDGGFDSYG